MLKKMIKVLIRSHSNESELVSTQNNQVISGEEKPQENIEKWLSEEEVLEELRKEDENIQEIKLKFYKGISITTIYKELPINMTFYFYLQKYYKNESCKTFITQEMLNEVIKKLGDCDYIKEEAYKSAELKQKKENVGKNIEEIVSIFGKYISHRDLRVGKGKGEVDNFKNNIINKRLKKNFSKSQLTLINLIESRGYIIAGKDEEINKEDILFTNEDFYILDNKLDSNFDFKDNDFGVILKTLKSIEELMNKAEYSGESSIYIKKGWNEYLSLSQYKALKILEYKGYEVIHKRSSIHPDGSYFPGYLYISWNEDEPESFF